MTCEDFDHRCDKLGPHEHFPAWLHRSFGIDRPSGSGIVRTIRIAWIVQEFMRPGRTVRRPLS